MVLTSLHQSIGAVLPDRLNAYEAWLTPSEPRPPADAAASVAAILESLQDEGSAFDVVTKRAGEFAAARSFDELWSTTRGFLRVLPYRLRARVAARLVARMLSRLCTETTVVSRRGSTIFIDLQGSPFLIARGPAGEPPCGFYKSAIVTFFELCRVDAAVRQGKSRSPHANSCLLLVLTDKARAAAAKGTILGLASDEAASIAQPAPSERPDERKQAEPVPAVEPELPTEPAPAVEPATAVEHATAALPAPAAAPESEGPAPSPEEPDVLDTGDRVQVEMRWEAIEEVLPAPNPESGAESQPPPGVTAERRAVITEWERL